MKGNIVFSAVSVFFLSILAISYQIGLMNALDFLTYSRFTNLIISIALLGFGASGTFITFLRIGTRKNPHSTISLLFILLIVSVSFGYIAAQKILPDVQYIFFSFSQLLRFILYILCFFIPFFLCACLIGITLSLFQESVHLIYGCNLAGSGIGGIIPLFLLTIIPAYLLPIRLSLFALAAYLFWLVGEIRIKKKCSPFPLLVLIFGTASTALSLFIVPDIKTDSYKAISYLRNLELQDSAEELWSSRSPSGTLHLFGSDIFHDALFAGPHSPYVPPAQQMLLFNGEQAGTIFLADNTDQMGILDYTPQSLAYRLQTHPRVLLLGETGGANIWLARRFAADSITVVQQNPDIVKLWKDVLPDYGVNMFNETGVTLINKNPRLVIKSAAETYDIIHVAGTEGMPAAQSGLYASEEDYLLTVQALQECFRLLSDTGCIAITRGIQSPPRDNLKIMALFRDVLTAEGFSDPGRHILQGKNYLAATTLLFKHPIGDTHISMYLKALSALKMDSEWHPGIKSGEIQQINNIPGPPGKNYSYLHFGAEEMLAGNREAFLKQYMYNILPPRDDKPYFHHFFKWRALGNVKGIGASYWFRSSELGYFLLVLTFGAVVIISLILIIIPLLAGKKALFVENNTGPQTVLKVQKPFRYLIVFPLIGTGFMFIEMVMIRKLGIFLGSPVYSITAVITSMLLFSGVGSVLMRKISSTPGRKIGFASLSVVIFLGISFFFFTPFVDMLACMGTGLRFIAALLYTAPLSFMLGWFFTSTMQAMSPIYPGAVPFGWGLNGFASVAAVPLSALLGMEIGYNALLAITMTIYAAVGCIALTWKTKKYK